MEKPVLYTYYDFRGALYYFRGEGEVVNCVFIDNINTGAYAGALMLNQASPNITNCTFYNNSSGSSGGAIVIFLNTALPIIANSILWNNHPNEIIEIAGPDPTITDCLILGGYAGTNIIDANPRFIDTASHDLRVMYQSPVINVGINDSIPSYLTTDLAGNDRVINSEVDLGAYEFSYVFPCGQYDSLSVSESPIFPSTYQATDQIASTGTVTTAASPVNYQSENEIILNPDFEVEVGSEFQARIENPCTD